MIEFGYIYQHRLSARFVNFVEDPLTSDIRIEYVDTLKSHMLLCSAEVAEHTLMLALPSSDFSQFELRRLKVTLSFV